MKALSIVAIILFAIVFTGCSATMPVQSGGTIEKHSGKRVISSASKFNFLGFTPMSLEVAENALTELQSKCDSEKVVGITNLYRRSFAFFGWNEKVELSGFCG